jgi:hypothetical protein
MKTSPVLARALAGALAFSMTPAALADYTVRCGSDGHRHRTCRLSEPGHVSLEKKISGADCVQGRTWDYNRREIWVDDGCEADFRVETHGGSQGGSSSSGKTAAAVVGVLAGAAILGALAQNKGHRDDEKYTDPNYQGARHSSYVPKWMVGHFLGYNPMYGAEVKLHIREDGRVKAHARGEEMRGFVNDERLHVGGAVFSIDQTRDGFVTHQVGDRYNEVRYHRQQ